MMNTSQLLYSVMPWLLPGWLPGIHIRIIYHFIDLSYFNWYFSLASELSNFSAIIRKRPKMRQRHFLSGDNKHAGIILGYNFYMYILCLLTHFLYIQANSPPLLHCYEMEIFMISINDWLIKRISYGSLPLKFVNQEYSATVHPHSLFQERPSTLFILMYCS